VPPRRVPINVYWIRDDLLMTLEKTNGSGKPPHVHTMPITFALQLVELVKRWHVPADELLSEVGLTEEALEDALARVPVATMSSLLERARLLTGEPGLGYYLGLQKRASVYGHLGFAALSAASLREALDLAVQFAPMFSTALKLHLNIEGRVTSLYLDEQVDLGPVRDIVLISMMLGLNEIGRALIGRELDESADFAIAEPDYHARFAHLVPNWRFGQGINRIVFATEALDSPIVMANRAALRLARAQCERALDELGFDTELVDRVRRLLASDAGGFHSLDHVAALVHMSPRTLKRRLAAQGVSFSTLVDRERCEKALLLLRSSRLSIEGVAERLDYATASTFVRAFHRWTGKTPAAYRRARRHGSLSNTPR
jgi:AraC-like DNA-binding protein